MQTIIKTSFLALLLGLTACESMVEGINENPNELTLEDVDAELFLTGAQLANSVAQGGHLTRIAGMWSGQLLGFTSLYGNIYGYAISTAESVSTWGRFYIGVVPQMRHIRNIAPEDDLLVGVAKVMEAHAMGSAASLFGDIPYSEISNLEIPDPKFDSQMEVLNAVITLLDDGISDLNNAVSRDLPQDIYFGGDASLWVEAAHTLKARYYMYLKDYSSAYQSAQNGISSAAGNLQHIPRGDASNAEGDKNLFWMILEGSRTGDIGTGDSYLMQMLNESSYLYRGNSKTNESARFHYYTIDESGGSLNQGIIEQFEPQDLVSFQENHLILAEAGARTGGFDTGLMHLNEYREYLNTGDFLNANFADSTFRYDAYTAADFQAGGMENMDNIAQDRALLREIVEERYVTGFLSLMPFDDARRLRKSDGDLIVPFPLNTSSATAYPERMLYSDDELNANANAPDDPGIFAVTEVNR